MVYYRVKKCRAPCVEAGRVLTSYHIEPVFVRDGESPPPDCWASLSGAIIGLEEMIYPSVSFIK